MATLIGGFDIEVDFSALYKEHEKQVQAGIEKCRTYISKLPINGRDAPLVGKLVRFQIADGYAEYMVASQKPLQLIYLDIGDGYQIPNPHMRGLNVADIRELVEREEALTKMFS